MSTAPHHQLGLTHLFTATNTVGEVRTIDRGPSGLRVAIRFSEGRFEGERLNGRLDPGGTHEESVVRSDGVVISDVEMLLVTDDGADILMTYRATSVATPTGLSIVKYPLFETGDERYAWINQVQAIALQSMDDGVLGPNFVYELPPVTAG
jgi:hypothetical protein